MRYKFQNLGTLRKIVPVPKQHTVKVHWGCETELKAFSTSVPNGDERTAALFHRNIINDKMRGILYTGGE